MRSRHTDTRGTSAETETWAHDRLPRNTLSQLGIHSTGVVAVVAVIALVGIRLILKTAKLGLLLAAPALVYLLHLH